MANGAGLDGLYGYDGMCQLRRRDRRDLNTNRDAVSSKNFAED
jgi:hypothetical protein